MTTTIGWHILEQDGISLSWKKYSVNYPGKYKKFDRFILIDALPKDKESFIKAITTSAKRHGLKSTDINRNLLTLEKGNVKVEYYINTTINEAFDNPTIRKKLNKVKFTYMKSVHPATLGLEPEYSPKLLENMEEVEKLKMPAGLKWTH